MRESTELKYLAFLQDLHAKIKRGEKIRVTTIMKKHKVSSNTVRVLKEGKIIVKYKTGFGYVWEWKTPVHPNVLMAKAVVRKVMEMSEKSISKKKNVKKPVEIIVPPVKQNKRKPKSLTDPVKPKKEWSIFWGLFKRTVG